MRQEIKEKYFIEVCNIFQIKMKNFPLIFNINNHIQKSMESFNINNK